MSSTTELLDRLTEIRTQKAGIESEEKAVKAELQAAMKEQKIHELENACIRVRYIEGFNRVGIDREKLQKLYPGAAAACKKSVWVDPFLKVQGV